MHTHDGVIRLSASDLVNHLSCRHLTRLNTAVVLREMEPPSYHDPFLALLQETWGKARGWVHPASGGAEVGNRPH